MRASFSVGGRRLRLASLTFRQVEDLLTTPAEEREIWPIVQQALRNAGERISLPQLKQLLDLEDLDALQEQVLLVSGLRNNRHKLPGLEDEEQDGPSGKPVDFAYLRSRLITALGWTFVQVDRAPFAGVMDLFHHWLEEPPAHRLLAGWVRYKPPAGFRRRTSVEAVGPDSTVAERQHLVGFFGGGVSSFDLLPAEMQSIIGNDLGLFPKPIPEISAPAEPLP